MDVPADELGGRRRWRPDPGATPATATFPVTAVSGTTRCRRALATMKPPRAAPGRHRARRRSRSCRAASEWAWRRQRNRHRAPGPAKPPEPPQTRHRTAGRRPRTAAGGAEPEHRSDVGDDATRRTDDHREQPTQQQVAGNHPGHHDCRRPTGVGQISTGAIGMSYTAVMARSVLAGQHRHCPAGGAYQVSGSVPVAEAGRNHMPCCLFPIRRPASANWGSPSPRTSGQVPTEAAALSAGPQPPRSDRPVGQVLASPS